MRLIVCLADVGWIVWLSIHRELLGSGFLAGIIVVVFFDALFVRDIPRVFEAYYARREPSWLRR